MKEGMGNLHLGHSESVPKDSFLLSLINKAIENGEIIQNKDLDIVFVSVDASLADKWITLGISRMYTFQGRDIMLIINPEQDVDF